MRQVRLLTVIKMMINIIKEFIRISIINTVGLIHELGLTRHTCAPFTFINLADAFIQSDFQERALQKCIGQ